MRLIETNGTNHTIEITEKNRIAIIQALKFYLEEVCKFDTIGIVKKEVQELEESFKQTDKQIDQLLEEYAEKFNIKITD